MRTENRDIFIFTKAVERRRKENNDMYFMSDWQVHSANIIATEISGIVNGFRSGPIYVPMPTGTGKTTGAVWGIVDAVRQNPEIRVCFLTPYQAAVEMIHADLSDKLGADTVGYYHANANVNKERELKKQVVVLTHQFISSNHNRLNDRDLFVVDEAIFATGEVTVDMATFYSARDWATANNIMAEDFKALVEFAGKMDQQLADSGKRFLAADDLVDTIWANRIATDFCLSDHAQSINNVEEMASVQRFCQALIIGQVFLARSELAKGGYRPIFSGAFLNIPKLDKTVVLSATGALIYGIAGPFSQGQSSIDYWTPPTYRNLTLVELAGPPVSGSYKTWGQKTNKDIVVAYIDWLIRTIPEQKIYLTVPAQVLNQCLRTFLGIGAKQEFNFPIRTTKYGKTVYVSNHSRSIGSNEFKDCNAVIYLWEDYKPRHVSVQRFHTLAGVPITPEALEAANSGKLSGDYERMRNAMLLENVMQQIGRGQMRQFDGVGTAKEMTAYILTTQTGMFSRLATQYSGCQTTKLAYDGCEPKASPDRIGRILNYLRIHGNGQDVPFKDVQSALGFDIRSYVGELEGMYEIKCIGYEVIRGMRGKGKSGVFKKIQ